MQNLLQKKCVSFYFVNLQLGEEQLKTLLERVNERTAKTTTVKVRATYHHFNHVATYQHFAGKGLAGSKFRDNFYLINIVMIIKGSLIYEFVAVFCSTLSKSCCLLLYSICAYAL